jgi:tRNA pseudouridine38/39 synthase
MQEILILFPEATQIIEKYLSKTNATITKDPTVPILKKSFSMEKYRQRKVALQIQYEGVKYFGFASQAAGDYDDTIEKHIFEALNKVCLIKDRSTCGYSRCGRTDKGVSALGQVIALNLRSAFPKSAETSDLPLHPNNSAVFESAPLAQEDVEGGAKRRKVQAPISKPLVELDYCTLLNRTLPDSIRVLGWTEVSEKFSARFSATHRIYRYFFISRGLDIAAMRTAAAYLVGVHDFRNLSKLDVANVSNFVREIVSADIVTFQLDTNNDEQTVYMLEIKGVAFLWHMVRCIMAVLFLVGEGKEAPSIVPELLNIESIPAKPHYDMADECMHSSYTLQFDWKLKLMKFIQVPWCFMRVASRTCICTSSPRYCGLSRITSSQCGRSILLQPHGLGTHSISSTIN